MFLKRLDGDRRVKFFIYNSVQVNTYLMYDQTKEAIVIDCGISTEKEAKELKTYLDFHHLQVKHLLNTHLHFDHILGNHFMHKTYGLCPQYHPLEEAIPNLKEQASLFGFSINYQSIKAQKYLYEGEIISFGDTTLNVILTDGHSPGSLSFYCEKSHCIFTGDALFYHEIGRTDLWGGSQDALISSIQNKILTLPDETQIFPGHGRFSFVKEEKEQNPFFS